MKKFSTAALVLALASASGSAAAAGEEAMNNPRCAFLPNAPDQHTVVRGDTLWGISGRFLQHPWCWPQVWGMNKEEIRNPHWIYPGQVVYFDRAAGRLRLGSRVGGGASDSAGAGAGGLPTVRLSPQLRTEGLGEQAVPAIPSNVIEPFLSQPLVVGEDELNDAPRIVATQEARVMLGKDDKAYVRGDIQSGTSFQVFRPGTPLRDPDTNTVIGYEAAYLGTIKLERAARAPDEAHVFNVVNVKQEMGVGDRLLPVPPTPMLNYVPHPPEQQVSARVMSVYGGVSQAGQNQIVAINRGRNEGLNLGTVLELYRYGSTVVDRTDKKSFWSMGPLFGQKTVKLPDMQYGSLFIFRVFDKIAYGLVMQVTEPVQVGDVARSPE
ncbi:MAG TPA: LysM peptidoglycan-binding domain-containing protein [Noviherbaspirillum sp.]|uniref:LysM peptidoglycan-binding domain-containing protein n=1 Tax=Noviherbaspirillum sp. TaxID=1926288 RepID=UPI002D3AEC3D|nr:LysM peptidoglycan-binding domain-containing protein [Noviherbaspirillum sp.]HYD95105.1 LysM peptidoglycan-binding domain-containing protein [Noviherbaspirillum sp.]